MKRLVAPRKPAAPAVPDTGRFWDIERDGLTAGFLENLLCPERLRLRYVEGLESSRFKGAQHFGNVIHAALETGYTAFRDSKDPGAAVFASGACIDADEAIARARFREAGELTAIEAELEELYGTAGVVLRHYWEAWHEEDFGGGREWVSLEEVFRIPFTFQSDACGEVTIPLRGKIDGKYRAKNRRLWVKDTKTKGQIEVENIAQRLSMDLQTLLYSWATWRINGEMPAGVLYNVMRRPQLRRGKSETMQAFIQRVDSDVQKRPEFYFIRFEAPLPAEDLRRFEKELTSLVRLAYAWSRGSYHFRYSPACENKWGPCEFLHLCGSGDMGRLRKREAPYPELVQVDPLELSWRFQSPTPKG
jgi:RecB family exonuclease